MAKAGECVVDGRCVTAVPWVVTAAVLGLVEREVDVDSLAKVDECVIDSRCVAAARRVVTVAVLELGGGPHCLSNLALQCLPVAFKPCLIHSGCSSSFPSKQQYEHCLQISRTLAKKYPFLQVPLQILSEDMVQGEVTISSFAHC